jgi:hypothetical protein
MPVTPVTASEKGNVSFTALDRFQARRWVSPHERQLQVDTPQQFRLIESQISFTRGNLGLVKDRDPQRVLSEPGNATAMAQGETGPGAILADILDEEKRSVD